MRFLLRNGCWLLTVVLFWSALPCALLGAAENAPSYFSQGQAVHDPNDLVKSRDQALRDLESQAVMQAIGSFIGSRKVSSNYPDLQENILNQVDRYVESYQILSEGETDGLYRVTGQVTVAGSLLRQDLIRLGLMDAEDSGETGRVGETSPAATPPSPESAADSASAAAGPDTPGTPEDQEETSDRQSSHGAMTVLWLVSEKWQADSRSMSPNSGSISPSAAGLFAVSVRQEAQDFDWTLALPAPGPAEPADTSVAGGELGVEQGAEIADRQGADAFVVGTAGQAARSGGTEVVAANLEVFDVRSERKLGTIQREVSVSSEHSSDEIQEAVVQLAALVVPELDRVLLARPEISVPPLSSAPGSPSEPSSLSTPGSPSTPSSLPLEPPGAVTPGRWTLLVRSFTNYGDWTQLEQALRREYQGMRVVSLEFGADEARVKVDEVGPNLPEVLQGLQLKALMVQLVDQDPATHTVHIMLTPIQAPAATGQ